MQRSKEFRVSAPGMPTDTIIGYFLGTFGALFVIFVFALSRGIVTKWLSSSIMVYLGNGAFYYMMSHQVVMRYMGMAHYYFSKINMIKIVLMYIPDAFWVAVAFTITLVSRPLYEKYISSKFENQIDCKK